MEIIYSFEQYKVIGEEGIAFCHRSGDYWIGVAYCPDQPYGGSTMDEFHHGWLVQGNPSEGWGIFPPTSPEEGKFCEEMLSLAEEKARKVRRRIEDRLRKGGFWAVFQAAQGNETVFSETV